MTATNLDPPGLFADLVEHGYVPPTALDPLLRLLPDEHWVPFSPDSELFDSTRWPLAWDARLARACAGLLAPDPRLANFLSEVDAAAGDAARLDAIASRAIDRGMLAEGPETWAAWVRAGFAKEEIAAEPPWPLPLAKAAVGVALSAKAAAEGLLAYHVYRRLRLESSAAAGTVEVALDVAVLDVDGLVRAAIQCVA